jgi:hypothetical protein
MFMAARRCPGLSLEPNKIGQKPVIALPYRNISGKNPQDREELNLDGIEYPSKWPPVTATLQLTLIGTGTVNTLPRETLEASRDHGRISGSPAEGLDRADRVLERIRENGIDLDEIAQKLEDGDIKKFNAPLR